MNKRQYGCDLPFHHMAIQPNGQIRPCCYFRPDEVPDDLNISHPDPFNHPFLKYVRQMMLDDIPVEGCRNCYKDEQVSGRSMRTEVNESLIFGLPLGPERGKIEKLTNIDLAFSNVCNNRCRMCGPWLSTNWYSDAKKLGMDIPRGVVAKNSVIEDYDLSDLRFIKLIGGEPLMEQEKFIKLLNKCTLDKLSILLVTNATLKPNEELFDLFKQCKRVDTHLSIDAYGPINNFLRKGSIWEEIDSNVDWYVANMSDNKQFSVSIDSVVSIYNCNQIDQMIEYKKSKGVYSKFDMVDGPDWMRPRNIPNVHKVELLEIIKSQKEKYNEHIFDLLINELHNEGNAKDFVFHDNRLNTLRNETWQEHNSWLSKCF
jgi:MoaA/NifB/PqqE/SkfB family radical SAM enzyme